MCKKKCEAANKNKNTKSSNVFSKYLSCLPKNVVNQKISMVFREDPVKEEICSHTHVHIMC